MKRSTSLPMLLALVGLAGLMLFVSSTAQPHGDPAPNAALYYPVGQTSVTGGTLILGSVRPCDSFDPAASFDPWCAQVQRTYARNLFAFAGQAGAHGNTVLPDLAAKAAVHSSDFLKWQITLRSNIRWNDGSAVTSRDVVYSIERLYDSSLRSPVPNSVLCLLSSCRNGLPSYTGSGKHHRRLTSVTVSSDTIIHFSLQVPTPDFDRILAMPQLAPIQASRDQTLRKSNMSYASAPAANGPFTIQLGKGSVVATFVRNTQWEQVSDPIRSPRVERMVWRQFATQHLVEQNLLSNKIDIAIGAGLSQGVTSELGKRPRTSRHLDTVPINSINFLALTRQSNSLKKVECRRAIFYGLDKQDIVHVRGGPTVSSVAHTLIPPFVQGWSARDNAYSSGSADRGDLSAARRSLTRCGYPDGFEINLAFLDLGVGRKTYLSIQKSLSRIGIIVNPIPFADFSSYFSSGVGAPASVAKRHIDAVLASWGPDTPSAASFWLPLVSGSHIRKQGNQNLAELDDESINELGTQLAISGDINQQTRLSELLSRQVADSATYIPINVDNYALFRPESIAYVYIQPHSGAGYDIVNVAKVTNR